MEGGEDHTRNLATMEAPTRKVVGVKVCEVFEGVDVDKMKKLKYAVPNIDEYDIGKYLDFVNILTLMNCRSLQVTSETRTTTTSPTNRREGTTSSAKHLKTSVHWNIPIMMNSSIHGTLL
jgi:hypothetical protein